MTLYRATIYKRATGIYYTGEQWSNVYTIQEVNATEARGVAASVALLEAAVMLDFYRVYRIVVVDPNATDDRAVASVDYQGERSGVGIGSPMPLFNTVRIILTDDVQRPESKYLRGLLAADNIENGLVSSELRTAVQDDYVTPLLALNQVVGPDDNPITGGSVQAAVQMRQLGWHRRTRPGFRRGWVPV